MVSVPNFSLLLDRRNHIKFGVDGSSLPDMHEAAAIFVLREERRVLVGERADAFPRKQFVVAWRYTTNDEPPVSIACSGEVKCKVQTS